MQLRTIEQAHNELMSQDAGCALTLSALRRLTVSGKIPAQKIGKKYLIDAEKLPQFIEALSMTSTPAEVQENGIRRLY